MIQTAVRDGKLISGNLSNLVKRYFLEAHESDTNTSREYQLLKDEIGLISEDRKRGYIFFIGENGEKKMESHMSLNKKNVRIKIVDYKNKTAGYWWEV